MCPTITFRMYGRRYLEHGSVHQKKHMHFGTMQDFKSFWAIHCKETRRKCQELQRCATLFSSSTNTQCIKIFEFSWHKVILLQSDSLAKFQNSPLGVSHCQIFSRAYWSIVRKCNKKCWKMRLFREFLNTVKCYFSSSWNKLLTFFVHASNTRRMEKKNSGWTNLSLVQKRAGF